MPDNVGDRDKEEQQQQRDYITTSDDGVTNPSPYQKPTSNASKIYPGGPDFDPRIHNVFSRPIGRKRSPSSIRELYDGQRVDPARVVAAVNQFAGARKRPDTMQLMASMAIIQFNGLEVLEFSDPYSLDKKFQFENCYRADPVVNRCLDVLCKFTLGKRTHFHISAGMEETERQALNQYRLRSKPVDRPLAGPASFGPRPASAPSPATSTTATSARLPSPDTINKDGSIPLLTDDFEDEESPLSEQELRSLHRFISNINSAVKWHERLKAAQLQSYVYGRSAIKIIRNGDGIPTEFQVLNSKKLGTVLADKDTWRLLGVNYADNQLAGQRPEPLLAEDIIYFPNRDYHVSPDTVLYGYSRVEPVMHVSETNQILDEIDLKEAARSMWAGSGVIKFPPDTPSELIDEFVRDFYPGTWNATSQNTTIETYNLKLDYISLTNARAENDRRIIRGMGIPEFLVGFAEISNRAVADQIMLAWQESELDAERVWLQDILEPQWFDKLVGLAGFPDLVKSRNDFSNGKRSVSAPPIRVMMDFLNIEFAPLKDKVEAIIPLWDRGLMPAEKVMETIRTEDWTPEVLDEQERRLKEAEKRFQLELDLKKQRVDAYRLMGNRSQQGGGTGGAPVQRPPSAATAAASLQDIAALYDAQKNNATNRELDSLSFKWQKEAHESDMELRMQKKQVYNELMKTIKNMQEAGN